jgi:hypothetical protein
MFFVKIGLRVSEFQGFMVSTIWRLESHIRPLTSDLSHLISNYRLHICTFRYQIDL